MERAETVRLAAAWWDRISGLAYVPMPQPQVELLLAGMVERLAAALEREPFDPAPAARVGADLVRANLTNPAVQGPSAEVLAGLLPVGADRRRRDRFARLLGELSHGYTAELLETRARSQESLQQAMVDARLAVEARFRVVFDNAAVAIVVCDTRGHIVDVNPTTLKMLAAPSVTLRGVPAIELAHPEDRADISAALRELTCGLGGATVRFEKRFRRTAPGANENETNSETTFFGWAAWAVTLVPAAGGADAYLLAVGEDTTDRRVLQAELRRQARHDPLTGLPNRRHLLDELQELLVGAATSVGLCFADLDNFKAVNDRHGHGVGDRLLRAVAERLRAGVPGALLARIGGDEFVALLSPPCDEASLAATAEAMIDALAEPFSINGRTLSTSVSVGALLAEPTGADADALLDAADAGLYRAKAAGPGSWVLQRP